MLAADIYNNARLLFAHANRNCLFIPICRAQYLAVMDENEIIFVDDLGERRIELAWRQLRPQARHSLFDPVPYILEIYLPRGLRTVQYLQSDFAAALYQLQQRKKRTQGAGKAEVRTLRQRQ
ncbi:hypothetical protein LV476_00955 [Guyparkeria hydrothermalis]|uniref:hypothetical protein n=1 Tax=Guyparkeria hydrothermalis TaxID=923 RepID=UPI002021EF43|nr:hypothetical protein [Guyparkeria hydrothermalis]MCL7743524.1 hypothetical protein [Guyparkeria hydrothermalis]